MCERERLSRLPDPDLAWLDDLLDPAQPVPASRPSATVRTIQRGQAAEIAAQRDGTGVWPDTRGTSAEAVSGAASPVSGLFPKWGAA